MPANRMTRRIFVLSVLALLVPLALRSEIPTVQIGVDGLACPFCAYGLEKKLKKLPGVKDFEISINKGEATLNMKEGTEPDLSAVRAAVKSAGFSVRDLTITAIGTVTSQDQEIRLNVRHSQQRYSLLNLGDSQVVDQLTKFTENGALVSVTGSIPEDAENQSNLSFKRIEPVTTVLLKVEGMTCDKCDELITELIEEFEGVYRISVDLSSKRVAIESIGQPPSAGALVAAINGAGFEATVTEGQP